MKLLNSIVLLAGMAVSHQASAQLVTGPVYDPANGHAYYLTSSMTWSNAESLAINMGGHLVTINDAAENQWVADTFLRYGGTTRSLWLGLTDIVQEGNYFWLSGENSAYRDWAPGEPNNGGATGVDEDATAMWDPTFGYPYGSWTDSPIGQSIPGVIEVVPEPSSVACIALGLGILGFVKRKPQAS